MSSSIALRRSPKPGALTAAIFSSPRSLLTTSVASECKRKCCSNDKRGGKKTPVFHDNLPRALPVILSIIRIYSFTSS